jgi:hypothetical protein
MLNINSRLDRNVNSYGRPAAAKKIQELERQY